MLNMEWGHQPLDNFHIVTKGRFTIDQLDSQILSKPNNRSNMLW